LFLLFPILNADSTPLGLFVFYFLTFFPRFHNFGAFAVPWVLLATTYLRGSPRNRFPYSCLEGVPSNYLLAFLFPDFELSPSVWPEVFFLSSLIFLFLTIQSFLLPHLFSPVITVRGRICQCFQSSTTPPPALPCEQIYRKTFFYPICLFEPPFFPPPPRRVFL